MTLVSFVLDIMFLIGLILIIVVIINRKDIWEWFCETLYIWTNHSEKDTCNTNSTEHNPAEQRTDAFAVAEIHAAKVKQLEAEKLAEQQRHKQNQIDLNNNLDNVAPDAVKMLEKLIVAEVKKHGYSSVDVGLVFGNFPDHIGVSDIVDNIKDGLHGHGYDVCEVVGWDYYAKQPSVYVICQPPSNIKIVIGEFCAANDHDVVNEVNSYTRLRVEWEAASKLIGKRI